MKKLFNKNIITNILMFISLMLICVYTFIFTDSIIDLTPYGLETTKLHLIWIGFSISWVLIQLLIFSLFSYKKKIIIYLVVNFLWLILFFSQICFVQHLGKYMIFSDLFLAGEGLQYVNSIFYNLNSGMLLTILASIGIMVAIYIINKDIPNDKKKLSKKYIISMIVLIILTRGISYFSLGNEELNDTWKESINIKNIYNDYTNPNSSMLISGFYEYNIRCVYKYFYNLITVDKTLLKNNIDEYNNTYGVKRTDNDYTGIFKDKNVIYVMMESIDSWVVDKDTMPTLTRIKKEGINFNNRYSPFFNGGQTINTEFALNTGLYSIIDRNTIYDYDEISYPYSLANMLKENGYIVNSFHANTSTFYNRSSFHKLLGYSNHYSASDMQENGLLDANKNYFADSVLISDDDYFDNIVSKDKKFASFITTYSAHLEYTENNPVYSSIKHSIDCSKYSEEECVYRTLANDTDNFLNTLIKQLQKRDLLDNTIIVLVSDHYVYGYSDSEYVALKKGVSNDRKELQNTPFIIWSRDIESEDIDTILDTADILPTMLNLLGIDYSPNNYMGTDVFSDYHDKFVWFADYSYIKSSDCTLSNEAILTKVKNNIKKNKNILLTNYYGK